MSTRYNAARPKRASEAFARSHHGDPKSKKVKFDVRNPSALAPQSAEDDPDIDAVDEEVLAADTVGTASGGIKRGAVNVDGYDSDSDQDNFEARAETRPKSKKGVDLAATMDNPNDQAGGAGGVAAAEDDEDEEMDMFGNAEDEDNGDEGDAGEKAAGSGKAGKPGKEVRFLEIDEIEGQEEESKAGGTVKINDEEESTDEEDENVDLDKEMEEEGIDEEIGAGGLKKHAPKIDAFNMKGEQEEGRFDEAGNFIRNAADANAVHDTWLEGIGKKDMKKAAAAHEKREADIKAKMREADGIPTSDLLRNLILRLDRGETTFEALARLAKNQVKPKKVPKWKQKKAQKASNGMDVDEQKEAEDPKQVKIRESIAAITEAADRLLRRDYPEIYEWERERLIREYRNEAMEDWVEPAAEEEEKTVKEKESTPATTMWEYRWIDGRDGAAKQGPYDGPTMKAWQDAGYFGEGVEFRPAGQEGDWTRVATFM